MPDLTVPEYILINVKLPTKGSLATLNAKAENGALSSNFISTSSSDPGLVPFIEPMSFGLGKKFTTASKSGWTPLFLNADPVRTGTKSKPKHPFLMHAIKSFSEISFPPR